MVRLFIVFYSFFINEKFKGFRVLYIMANISDFNNGNFGIGKNGI